MVKLQVSWADAANKVKLQAAKFTVDGTGTAPKLRVALAGSVGVAPVRLQTMQDYTAEAYDSVTATVVKTSTSPVPDAYEWRQISGPIALFEDNGASITAIAPPSYDGDDAVFGVIAVLGADRSPEVTVTIHVIPHLYWVAGATDWEPLTRTTVAV